MVRMLNIIETLSSIKIYLELFDEGGTVSSKKKLDIFSFLYCQDLSLSLRKFININTFSFKEYMMMMMLDDKWEGGNLGIVQFNLGFNKI